MLIIKLLGLVLLLIGLSITAPTACENAEEKQLPATPPAPVLQKSELIGTYSAEQLRNRFSGNATLFRALIRHGISVYRLTYTTPNTDGKPVAASGTLLMPNVSTPAPLLSMQHGTIQSDYDAPSNFRPGSEANTFGAVFASQGYIIAAPDYIGYGASKNLPHPYEHRATLASASLDMLRAAREFMAEKRVNWNKQLFLAGYSEGGYATMALQKKIEEETGNEFNLVASSCGAGAYDKPAFMRKVINEKTSGMAGTNRLYIWVLLTYDRIYGLNRPMTYYFREPYATQIAKNGRNASINVSLHTTFTDTFRQAINTGTDRDFLNAVADNDLHNWKPRTPTRLYHGDADQTVFYLNSRNAYEAMQKRGADNVTLQTLRGANHGSGIAGFILGTYEFFLSKQPAATTQAAQS